MRMCWWGLLVGAWGVLMRSFLVVRALFVHSPLHFSLPCREMPKLTYLMCVLMFPSLGSLLKNIISIRLDPGTSL